MAGSRRASGRAGARRVRDRALLVLGCDGDVAMSTGRVVLPPGLPTEEACGVVVDSHEEVVRFPPDRRGIGVRRVVDPCSNTIAALVAVEKASHCRRRGDALVSSPLPVAHAVRRSLPSDPRSLKGRGSLAVPNVGGHPLDPRAPR
jgi:hypothetical protein